MTKAEAKAAMALHHRRGISLKAAWAQVKHGVRASPGATRKTRSAKPSNGSSPKGGRIGRIYQAAGTALAVLSPVTDEVLKMRGSGGGRGAVISMSGMSDHLGNVKDKVISVPYATNLAVEGATAFVDKKFGQAAAISRGSVSAILPEVVLGAMVEPYRGNLASAHNAWSKFRNGYEPYFNKTTIDDRLKTYRLLKHGGQVARKLRTRSEAHGGLIARLLKPVGENLLRPFGLTW